MVWQPGQSGNPNGHVRKTKGYNLRAIADNYTISALNTIVSLMENPEVKPADRLIAARMVLDRAHGTPVQSVELNTSVNISLVELLAGLPGQGRPVIEHDGETPKIVGGVSLLEAAQAAEELAIGQGADAGDDSQAEDEDGQGDTHTLVLRPANDDPGDDS